MAILIFFRPPYARRASLARGSLLREDVALCNPAKGGLVRGRLARGGLVRGGLARSLLSGVVEFVEGWAKVPQRSSGNELPPGDA